MCVCVREMRSLGGICRCAVEGIICHVELCLVPQKNVHMLFSRIPYPQTECAAPKRSEASQAQRGNVMATIVIKPLLTMAMAMMKGPCVSALYSMPSTLSSEHVSIKQLSVPLLFICLKCYIQAQVCTQDIAFRHRPISHSPFKSM